MPWGHPAVVGIGLIAMFCVAMAGHRAQQSLEQQENQGQAPMRRLSSCASYEYPSSYDRSALPKGYEEAIWTEDDGERFPDTVRVDASTWCWIIVGALSTALFAIAMAWQIVYGLTR